ncbi:SGNH/GDSL hydrolase family protein [Pontibacter oryzae]|uniref:SGNH/GDSL hydrolase family protein n=1 Tax=Pontibacter oryzae TaxID=2304593 RepID=UPI0013152D0A|nr:SGNH/GDSL hydrolase family protein [Pontibacter oryzae]
MVAQTSLSKPENLTARASFVKAIIVRWQAVEGAEGYTIEKSATGEEDTFSELAIVDASTLSIRDAGLGLDEEAYYRVKATAGVANAESTSGTVSSPYSAIVSARTNPDELIRIMPLGDSNTEGGNGSVSPENRVGYRKELYRKLVIDGRLDGYQIDFVGNEQMGEGFADQFLADNGFELDVDHAGYGGARNQDILSLLKIGKFNFYGQGDFRGPGDGPYLDKFNPDVIFLHIGTNDISNDGIDDSQNAVDNLEMVLNEIDKYEQFAGKEVTVILAKIIKNVCATNSCYRGEHYTKNEVIDIYNTKLQALASKRFENGDRLELVDMADAGIVYDFESDGGDMADLQHPAQQGYDKMAGVWSNSISPILSAAAAPLPVELMHFGAAATNNEIILTWSTASEENNRHFELQRMHEGIDFTTIGTVAGAGNSLHKLNYTYHDNTAPAGKLLYRLRQVDLDGTFTYSKIVSVTYAPTLQKEAQVYPNPTNKPGQVHLLAFGYVAETPVTIRLFSAIGALMYSQSVLPAQSGEVRTTLPITVDLPVGLYVLKINSSSKAETLKLILK